MQGATVKGPHALGAGKKTCGGTNSAAKQSPETVGARFNSVGKPVAQSKLSQEMPHQNLLPLEG